MKKIKVFKNLDSGGRIQVDVVMDNILLFGTFDEGADAILQAKNLVNVIKVHSDIFYISFTDYHSGLFYKVDERETLLEFDEDFKVIAQLNNGYNFSPFGHNRSKKNFAITRRINSILEYGFYNLPTGLVVKTKFHPKCYCEIILALKTYHIERYSTEGSILWSVDYTDELAKLGDRHNKILTIIGISDGVIICRYDNGQVGIGINVETGHVKWIEEGWFISLELQQDGTMFSMGPPMTVRDVHTGKIIGEYGEVDSRMYTSRGVYSWIGDHIILSGSQRDTIAAFNTKTHKIDWIHKEEGVWFPDVPMKYFHPYLFVNDSKGNLHVFEVSDEMAKINNNNLLT